jgi:hypothetical protein
VTPLAGEPPQLDGLLLEVLARRLGWGIDRLPQRRLPAPPLGSEPPLPLGRAALGPWLIYRSSSPIYTVQQQALNYLSKRSELAQAWELYAPTERQRRIAQACGWAKAYYVPFPSWEVREVVWFVWGERAGLEELLAEVLYLGTRRRHGCGRVVAWEITPAAEDFSWFSLGPTQQPVLMRPLPALWDLLPENLCGWRPDFGACAPPYWHPDRYTEILVPA